MTLEEFTRLMDYQRELWPHARESKSYDAVYDLLAGLDYGDALAAVKAAALDGDEYPPNGPGIIRRAAQAHAGAGEADLEAAFNEARRLGAFAEPPAFANARAELERRVGPELAAFVARHYREWAMAGGPNGDPVTVVRAQLRQAWDAAGRRATTEAAHELAGITPLRRVTPGDEAPPPRPLRLPPSARPGA